MDVCGVIRVLTDLIEESSTKCEEIFGVGSKYPTSAESPIVRSGVMALRDQLFTFKVMDGIYMCMYIGLP